MFDLGIAENSPTVSAIIRHFGMCTFTRAFNLFARQTGKVQTLQQRDCSCAGRPGVGGLSHHGGQRPAVWWGIPASLRAQHTYPVRGSADRAHPGALQLPGGLSYPCWTPQSPGDHQRNNLAARTPLPAGERGFAGRVGEGVPFPAEGRELVHAVAPQWNKEDGGLV